MKMDPLKLFLPEKNVLPRVKGGWGAEICSVNPDGSGFLADS